MLTFLPVSSVGWIWLISISFCICEQSTEGVLIIVTMVAMNLRNVR
jgi:hypothetical protein